MGASYALVKNVAANLREHEDPWNTAAGGFCAGAIAGMKSKDRLSKADVERC
jgi:hypothetical protein